MLLEKGETTPLFVAFGLTAHPSDDRTVTARDLRPHLVVVRDGMRRQIGLNLGLDGACFLGDETGSDAMSEATQHYAV